MICNNSGLKEKRPFMSYRKKLIEVALPLVAINKAASTEKSIRYGHPSTLHLWWARRPLAICRAVLFASLIEDPGEDIERFPTPELQNAERDRLFRLIERMVEWKNIHDADLIQEVQAEILKATNGNPPPVFDPFAGGGSIPLEAQRLGLESHASDLNPVAVLINKALIEIPPRFANQAPVNPSSNPLLRSQKNGWKGAYGLANDVRYYGQWMRDEAEKQIGHFYPKVTLPKEYGGGEATVIAWLWAKTVKCNNPACGAQAPLTRSFALSTKEGKEAYVEPVIDREVMPAKVSFVVKAGTDFPPNGTKIGHGSNFKCICCGNIIPDDYIKSEGMAKRIGAQLTAIVADSKKTRVYLSPTQAHEDIASKANPEWVPSQELAGDRRAIYCPLYGLTTIGDLFTTRQLLALTTFSDLMQAVRGRVLNDARAAGLSDDDQPLYIGGYGAQAYADAVTTYLGMGVSRLSDICNALCRWEVTKTQVRNLFARQAIPMLWDFAEPNVFADAAGDFRVSLDNLVKALEVTPAKGRSIVKQQDATVSMNEVVQPMISTDPPYYDNIGYADLSDFFYVWLRRSLGGIYPNLFRTMLVPKATELIAAPYRFEGSKQRAQEFFETGLSHAFERMRAVQHPDYPLTVYYAFKQAENETEVELIREESNEEQGKKGKPKQATVASTGWETMLEGLVRAGFEITGSWPVRTELANRTRGLDSNALASSIVLVCRPRPAEAQIATRREFLGALRKELPEALHKLQHGSIAPVDLAQASIGPGMSIYSRYSQVVESDGTPLRVRTALQMINQELDAALAEQEGEYDRETRWAIAWFEQYGMQEGEYGVAETLSKAKNMSVARLEHTGLVVSKAGKVRLKRREELSEEWTAPDSTVWEVTQRMIYALLEGKREMGGENGTANILRQALSLSENVRDLLYRLYTVCERKGWAQEALAYNGLVTSWTRITDLAHRRPMEIQQATLL
jgi:putative DNA methylase